MMALPSPEFAQASYDAMASAAVRPQSCQVGRGHDRAAGRLLQASSNPWLVDEQGCRSDLFERSTEVHTTSYKLDFATSGALTEHAAAVGGRRTTGPHVISLPGLSEHIEGDIRRHLQTGLSALLPETAVTSIGTSGIGELCAGESVELKTMGERSLQIAEAMQQRRRVLGMCTSMGTVIFNELANQNLDAGEPVPIQGQVLLSPAIVPPENVCLDMGIRFLPRLAWDTARQTKHLPLGERVQAVRRFPHFMRQLIHDFPPIANSILQLLEGTPEEKIERTVSRYRTLVITGEHDPIGEIPMWQRLQEKYPDQLKLVVVPKRGHDLMLFHDAPYIVERCIRQSGILED